jgi:hypothetical protein
MMEFLISQDQFKKQGFVDETRLLSIQETLLEIGITHSIMAFFVCGATAQLEPRSSHC